MKRIWIALGLIAVIIAVCIWEYSITANMYKDMSIKTENIKESIEKEDYREAEEIYKTAKSDWEKYKKSLSMFISHDRVHQTDLALEQARINIENQSKDDLLSEIGVLEVQVNGIKDSEEVNPQNLL